MTNQELEVVLLKLHVYCQHWLYRSNKKLVRKLLYKLKSENPKDEISGYIKSEYNIFLKHLKPYADQYPKGY